MCQAYIVYNLGTRFVIGGTDRQTDEFYDKRAVFFLVTKVCDMVVLASDLNVKFRNVGPSKACSGGRCTLPTLRTDGGDRLL